MTRTRSFSWSDIPLSDQSAILDLIGNDGHTLWKPEALARIHPLVATEFTVTYESDFDDPKATIFTDASPTGTAAEMTAVYGLTVLSSMAHYHGLNSSALGRGFRARELTGKLRDRIKAILES